MCGSVLQIADLKFTADLKFVENFELSYSFPDKDKRPGIFAQNIRRNDGTLVGI